MTEGLDDLFANGLTNRALILLTRIEDWQAVAAVHGEFFREIRPINTIMQVSRFTNPMVGRDRA
jgi:hypothetical protein